tara:strand:+ start:620 stop:850 length:231 start_codon:yes stop_codon:yes gene_type:complete
MSDSNYIKIYTGNPVVVQRIVSELEKENINAIVKEQNESGLNPIFGGHLLQQISVHKDELDKAVIVVENITSELQS